MVGQAIKPVYTLTLRNTLTGISVNINIASTAASIWQGCSLVWSPQQSVQASGQKPGYG
jgi:hypothetical protein